MPIVAPLVGMALRAVATRAAGPLLARGASAIAGRAVSSAQLARMGELATRSVRVGATASRLGSFAANGATGAANASTDAIQMESKPLPTFKSPTMGGEYVDG